MKQIIQKRPEQFSSITEATRWAIDNNYTSESNATNNLTHQLIKNGNTFIWRTNLMKTAPWWEEWFTELSTKFMSCKVGKLLVIAHTNRLDTPLTIAQMQGKFQLEILQKGHQLHEECPKELAEIIIHFYKRQLPLKLPPKLKLK